MAWILLSPALLSRVSYSQQVELSALDRQEVLTYCRRLDSNLSLAWPLNGDIAHLPLGKYAEALIGMWLEQSRQWLVHGTHGQVQRGTLTLGEYDFLLEDRACGQRQHWEFSVNFFLLDPSVMSEAFGPNLIDTLSEKCNRVFARQLLLSNLPEFRANFGTDWQAKALFQGWIFLPLTEGTLEFGVVSPQAASGLWCQHKLEDLARLQGVGDALDVSEWLVPDKPMWIAPRMTKDFSAVLHAQRAAPTVQGALDQWHADVTRKGRDAPLLLGFRQGREVIRAFVVNQA